MLVIRDEQLSALAAVSREVFIVAACEHLQRHFETASDAEPATTWRRRVELALAQATALGLREYRLQWKFLHLSAVAGWDFTERPQLQWITRILTDPRVSSASARLERALDELRYRIATQAANEALSQSAVPGAGSDLPRTGNAHEPTHAGPAG